MEALSWAFYMLIFLASAYSFSPHTLSLFVESPNNEEAFDLQQLGESDEESEDNELEDSDENWKKKKNHM